METETWRMPTSRQLDHQSTKVQPTHCVVNFTDENNFSLVPVKKLNTPVDSVVAGCDCMVEWGKKKQLFKATVMGVGSLAEMKKLESNLLSEMLNPTCKSNEEQDNNDTSGTKGSTKSKSRKTGSSKESNKKRPRSGRQKNPPTKKRKQAAEADDFHIEVGSPAKHSEPPRQVESVQNSEPSTSVTEAEHSEPSSKTVVDHADISSDSSDSDTDANLYSAVDDALSNIITISVSSSASSLFSSLSSQSEREPLLSPKRNESSLARRTASDDQTKVTDMWKELKELRSQQETVKDMVQLVLNHVRRIEQSLSQSLPPIIHNDHSNWEYMYPFMPPTTPLASQHVPTSSQPELSPIVPPFQPEFPPTTPVSQQQLPPLMPTTPVAPQHVLSPSTLIAQHPQQQSSRQGTSPWVCPLQPVEAPAPKSSASVPSHDLHFTPSFLASIRARSCSRQNFAVNLVRSLFTVNERKVSNVAGVLGKKKLDPKRIVRIKEATFQTYPLEAGETIVGAWALCIKSIDESCRRLNRIPKGKEN